MKGKKYKNGISKRCFALLISILMVVAMLPSVALAEETGTSTTAVAKVGEKTYTTVKEAFEEANAGDTITLLSDATANDAISVDKAITLDLNGKTLTTKKQSKVGDDGIWTIKDSGTTGKVELECNGGGIMLNEGKLILNSGTLHQAGGENVFLMGSAKFEMNGGALLADKGACIDASYGEGVATVEISGGVIDTKTTNTCAFYIAGRYGQGSVEANITGGKFTTGGPDAIMVGDTNSTLTITGGTFTGDISKYVDTTRYDVTNNNNTYTVAGKEVAEFNGQKYNTLLDAYTAMTKAGGGTITVLKDCEGDGFGSDKDANKNSLNYTIDFGGHTYTITGNKVGSTGTVTQGVRLLKGSKATFKNGTVKAGADVKELYQLFHTYGDVTLQDFTIDAIDNAYTCIAFEPDCGTVNILGKSSILASEKASDPIGLYVAFWHYGSYNGTSVNVNTTGTITGKLFYEFDERYTGDAAAKENKAILNISNGNFDITGIETSFFGVENDDLTVANIDITGGTFAVDPSKYVKTDKFTVTEKDKKYTVAVKQEDKNKETTVEKETTTDTDGSTTDTETTTTTDKETGTTTKTEDVVKKDADGTVTEKATITTETAIDGSSTETVTKDVVKTNTDGTKEEVNTATETKTDTSGTVTETKKETVTKTDATGKVTETVETKADTKTVTADNKTTEAKTETVTTKDADGNVTETVKTEATAEKTKDATTTEKTVTTTDSDGYTTAVTTKSVNDTASNIASETKVEKETAKTKAKIIEGDTLPAKVAIDATAASSDVKEVKKTEVTLPKATVAAIKDAAKATDDKKVETVELKTDVATLEIDNTALLTLTKDADSKSLVLTVAKTDSTVEKTDNATATFELTAALKSSDGTESPVFDSTGAASNGTIKVNVAYEPEKADSIIEVYYVAEGGSKTKMNASYEDGVLSWDTNHFSTYEVVEAANADLAAKKLKASSTTVTVKAADYKTTKITWKAIENADKYQVYRSTSKNSGYKKISTTTGKSLKNTGLKTGKKYYYKVRAYAKINDSTVYSKYSSVKAVKTSLAKVSSIKLQTGNAKVTASWSKVKGASGYKLYRSTKKSSGFKCVKTIKSGSKVKYVNKKLKKGRNYYYKVRAYRTVDGKKVYGAYSSVKKVRVYTVY